MIISIEKCDRKLQFLSHNLLMNTAEKDKDRMVTNMKSPNSLKLTL